MAREAAAGQPRDSSTSAAARITATWGINGVVEEEAKNAEESGPAGPDAEQPAEAAGHIETCPRCGQPFDNRILHQVIYHDQPTHKPIDLNT